MKDLDTIPYLFKRGEDGGAWKIPFCGEMLLVVASNGMGWDHVSVSLAQRTPTWAEMEAVKRMFFLDHETAMQLHVPPTDHISCHPNCLHLWRPQKKAIPRPPGWMVGLK